MFQYIYNFFFITSESEGEKIGREKIETLLKWKNRTHGITLYSKPASFWTGAFNCTINNKKKIKEKNFKHQKFESISKLDTRSKT